jgi:hypothetical protein
LAKKMTYIGEEEREIPQHGVFKPGDIVEYNETLYETGLFDVVEKKKKEGDK